MAARVETSRSVRIPILAALGCMLALVLGGALTRPNLDWYATLTKPGFTPPNAAFPVVWTILYAMMALAAWLAWFAPGKESDSKLAMIWFGIQLVIGVAWSAAFFSLRNIALGLLVILALLVATVITIVLFHRLSRKAALLLVPYLLWVAFATMLNVAFFLLNG